MSLRFRTPFLAALLVVIASFAAAAPASAKPRVESLDAIAYQSKSGRSDYVVFNVRASDASQVRVSWGRRGQGRQRVRGGQVGIGFARKGARSFRIRARACKRKRCGRVRRFKGSFRIVRTSTDPRPNSPVIETPDPLEEFIGVIPPLPIPAVPITAPVGGGPVAAPSP